MNLLINAMLSTIIHSLYNRVQYFFFTFLFLSLVKSSNMPENLTNVWLHYLKYISVKFDFQT